MTHTLATLLTHAVFLARDGPPLIIEAIRAALHGYLGGILREPRNIAIIIG